MTVHSRKERFAKITTLLDFPLEQRPTPHARLTQMLIAEQALNLKLTNTEQPWNLVDYTLTTVVGQTNYEIIQPLEKAQQSGKVYFVLRETGNTDMPFVPIEYDDFNSQEFGKMPTRVNSFPINVPEKISFYRTGVQEQERFAVLQPTPTEILSYKIWFYTGSVDRLAALMDQPGIATDLVDYLDLSTAISLLPVCEWEDIKPNSPEEAQKVQKIGRGLLWQFEGSDGKGGVKADVKDYIRKLQQPTSIEMPAWNGRLL